MSAISDKEGVPRLHVRTRERALGPFAGLRRHWNEAQPLVAPPREAWPLALRRARWLGLSLLVTQFLALCWWQGLLAHRFALSADYAIYSQPMYLIAHGDLNPYSTLLAVPFWHNSFELIIWPLSLIQAIGPFPVTLKVAQTVAMVAAEAVALGWICDMAAVRAERERTTAIPVLLVGLGVLLLVANPWYVYSLSFDFHPAPFIILFLLAGARDVFRDKRRAWIWLVLAMTCSALGATYVVALGAATVMTGRHWLKPGIAMMALGIAWLVFVSAIGGSGSVGVYSALVTGHMHHIGLAVSGLGRYSLLDVAKAIIEHPGRTVSILWSNGFNFWAEISAAGLIGVLWPPALIPSVVILLEAGLIPVGADFSAPGLQNNIPVGPLVTVGTIAILAALFANPRLRRVAAPAILGVLAINAVAWAVVWFPQVPQRWLTVSGSTAAALHEISTRITADDEVVASQGVVGGFGRRRYVYALASEKDRIPIRARRVWVIITPRQGVELVSVASAYADVAQMQSLPGARLVMAKAGVWVFEWNPPKGDRRLVLHGTSPAVPAWVVGGAAGKIVRQGRPSTWHVASTAEPGYTLSSAYYAERPGAYRASVSLSVARSANVEVWDDSTNTLLVRRVLGDTHGLTTARLPVDLKRAAGGTVYNGWGPWRTAASPPGDADELEIRVWSPGGAGLVKVYRARLAPRK